MRLFFIAIAPSQIISHLSKDMRSNNNWTVLSTSNEQIATERAKHLNQLAILAILAIIYLSYLLIGPQ